MGTSVDGSLVSRRDVLVQQLLQERRRRLQEKLVQDTPPNLSSGRGSDRDELLLRFDDQPAAALQPASPGTGLSKDWQFSSPRLDIPQQGGNAQQHDPIAGSAANVAGPPSLEVLVSFPTATPDRQWKNGFAGSQSVGRDEPGLRSRLSSVGDMHEKSIVDSWHIPQSARGGGSRSVEAASDSLAHRRPTSAPRARQRPAAVPPDAQDTANAGLQAVRSYSSTAQPDWQGDMPTTPSRPASVPPVRSFSREPEAPPKAVTPRSFRNRVQAWNLQREASKQRYQLARQEQESRELEQCTFRPAINGRSEMYAQRSRACSVEPLAQRLHHEGDKRLTLRNKARELLEADELCAYSFRPQINPSNPTKKRDRTPIHIRARQIQQAKLDKIRSAQAKEDGRDCTFQPRISNHSERIVQKKRDKLYRSLSQGSQQFVKSVGPVGERLYAEAHAIEQRRGERSVCESVQSAPSVDEESRRICQSSVYFQGAQQDFLTRQQTFELARQRRMEVRARHAKSECSFRPTISDNSRHIAAGNHKMIGETQEERVHRLAVKDVEHREQMKDALHVLHYRDCTFKPEINIMSQATVSKVEDSASDFGGESISGVPVHERLYRIAAERSKCSNESELEEHSFQPQLDSRSTRRFSHVRPRYTSDGNAIMENIQRDNERKAEMLAERRRELEEEKQAECTFAPETHKPYQEPQKPVVVSGLGRFFELRSLAQQQQREQQEREARVFRPEASRQSCAGITIPEPFDLSTGPRGEVGVVAAIEGAAGYGQESMDISFAPRTNESNNREIIRQLMNCALPEHALPIDEGGYGLA